MDTSQLPEMVAAVDLGSNSFHLLVARVVEGHLHVVDHIKEPVRLASGLDEADRLTPEARERALGCLERFGQRLRDLPPGAVRAVGTNTLRKARDRRDFLEAAEAALGHDVEVVSGTEEARLIYQGVSHGVPGHAGRRLVADIGGGSTEVVLGERFEPFEMDSLYMGCVSWTLRFFPDGRITEARMGEAELAARQELEPIARHYRALGWERCYGSSGTILAVEEVARAHGWIGEALTPQALHRLRQEVIAAEQVDRLDALEGLKSGRAPVLPGGLAILDALFRSLGIERMIPSSGSMREGLLHDLLGRIRHEDVRDRTIRRMTERYHVDEDQAARVERKALRLLEQAAPGWGLDPVLGRRFLVWASRLHEIGQALSYSGHHKHGAYLITHSDMPGFSRDDQEVLAAMVRNHRRKLATGAFPDAPAAERERAVRLCLLLRLAVVLSRGRADEAVPRLTVEPRDDGLTLSFPPGWLEGHPLTDADLRVEIRDQGRAGYRLEIR